MSNRCPGWRYTAAEGVAAAAAPDGVNALATTSAVKARWRVRGRGAVTAILIFCLPGESRAQGQVGANAPTARDSAVIDSLQEQSRRDVLSRAHSIRLHEVGLVVGGVAALTLLDEPVQRFAQRHRSHGSNHVATVFRYQGEPVYYAGVSLGVLGAGLVTGSADVQRAGGRLVAAVAISGLTSEGMKRLVGRSRPNERAGAFAFHPFTSLKDSAGIEARGAMPSGHTAAAFAVATSLADDIDSPVVDALLYVFAAGTGFSRINDNRHWLSDTVMGAALGITAAKFSSGRWRFFDLRPPAFLVTPSGTPALGWRAAF